MASAAANIDDRQVRALLERLGSPALRGRAANAGAVGVRNAIRAHLFTVNRARPNRLGGKRTNFYAQAGRSTTVRRSGNGTPEVAVTQAGFAQRLFGGTIRPVKAKRLAIPVAPQAHGKAPGEFNDLELVFWRRNGQLQMGLARAQQTFLTMRRGRFAADSRRTREESGRLMYVLKKEVTQRGDRTLLPTDGQLTTAASAAITDFLDAQTAAS